MCRRESGSGRCSPGLEWALWQPPLSLGTSLGICCICQIRRIAEWLGDNKDEVTLMKPQSPCSAERTFPAERSGPDVTWRQGPSMWHWAWHNLCSVHLMNV